MNPLTVVGAALLTASIAQAGDEKPFELMVGDPAPAIEVREWVQGNPVAAYEAGQVYVVEFWATWCAPCRKAIPHMNELAASYGDEVQFVGVSTWERISEEDPYSVPAFVAKMGDKMTYNVASDRTAADQEGVMAKNWMEAAGQGGIPTAFIVDGSGRVAWIGSPFVIDEPLAQITAGEWNLEEAAQKHAREMAEQAAYGKVRRALSAAKKGGNWDVAAAVMDQAMEEFPGLESKLAGQRYDLYVNLGQADLAATYGRKIVRGVFAENAGALNAMAWGIIDPRTRSETADVELAKLAGYRASELTDWKEPAILDTYAMALFLLGEHDKAIKVQEKAVKFSAGTTFEAELKARLAEYSEAVAARS